MREWHVDTRAASKAMQSIRSGRVNVSVLARTIENHRDFVGRKAYYSETPGSSLWDTDPGQARAALYTYTAVHVIARTHGGFRNRRFDGRKTDSML